MLRTKFAGTSFSHGNRIQLLVCGQGLQQSDKRRQEVGVHVRCVALVGKVVGPQPASSFSSQLAWCGCSRVGCNPTYATREAGIKGQPAPRVPLPLCRHLFGRCVVMGLVCALLSRLPQ